MNSQLRHFAFTWNNYQKQNDYFQWLCYNLDELGANYYIIAKEVAPTTGTPHLQGYVQLKKRKYFKTIIKYLSNIHITIVNGSSQDNIDYCRKADDNPYEFGTLRDVARGRAKQKEDWDLLVEMASQGQLDDLREFHPKEYALYYRTWHQMRMDHMKVEPTDRFCLWVHGKPGIGKSRAVWALFPDAYPKMANKWWDGYTGEQDVILDDLSTHMLFDLLKRWTDRYKVIGEVKGLSCALCYDKFIITSNYSIRQIAEKNNSEVDEVTIEAIQRRFVEVEAVCWDDLVEDLEVRVPHYNINPTLRMLCYDLLQK